MYAFGWIGIGITSYLGSNEGKKTNLKKTPRNPKKTSKNPETFKKKNLKKGEKKKAAACNIKCASYDLVTLLATSQIRSGCNFLGF